MERFVRWALTKQNNWWGLAALLAVYGATAVAAVLVHVRTHSDVLPWLIVGGGIFAMAVFVAVMVALGIHYKISIPVRTYRKRS